MPASGTLEQLAAQVRAHPGLTAKSDIGLVTEVLGPTDWLRGPGDDGAAVPALGSHVVACGEALLPAFVRADPYGAGVAAVLTNLNDLAAMGAEPLGIVDTIVGDEATARAALRGMRMASELYGVPILGGHLTRSDTERAISAFGVGTARHPLSMTHVAAGQSIVVAAAVEGQMRADFPFFRSFEARGDRCAADLRVLAEVADSGAAVAAKDISMAGVVGSLAMLLEWGGYGAELDLDRLPAPTGVELARWLVAFPSFGFLLCAPPGREVDCLEPFRRRGLCAEVVGRVDGTGQVRLRRAGQTVPVVDVRAGVTRLHGPTPATPTS
ncbi:MAG TPA: AIR synthase related protein [Actinomycetes bacterium]|nr:AIR synthase related protein [Actinomycetes bacterium]